MKTLPVLLLILSPLFTFAQNKVNAEEIIRKIDNGESVRYENVEVVGELDFLSVKDVTKKRKSGNDQDVYEYHIRSSVRFNNCTFSDDAIAYFYDEGDKSLHNAIFYEDVVFTNCEFEEESAFKYVKFHQMADFSGSVFQEEANFKYVDFPEGISFQSAFFNGDADFKYAKFTEGADFSNAMFDDFANFKYTKFSEPLNMQGTAFEGSQDFKYTKVGGKDFTTYLLNNR